MADDKPQKSVAFAAEQDVVDPDGEVTQKSVPEADKPMDEMNAMFEGLGKKKKKKPKKEDKEEEEPKDGSDDVLSLKKKKLKKALPDFDAELAQAGATADETKEEKDEAGEEGVQEGDLVKGTGIWAHDCTTPYTYASLAYRFYTVLHDSHPDLASSGSKSYKIPPPQCLREGNKKTIFANIADICRRMKRTDEHVTQFLFAELGTSGSVDGSRRLVIKGRFQQKQIENVLRRYIVEYVTCKTCRSPDTELNKGENRLYFVTCNSCGSRRSVAAIKTGFSAQVGRRRRMQ